MTSTAPNDAFAKMLADIAGSTNRLKTMVEEAHALVRRLESRRRAATTKRTSDAMTVYERDK